MKIIVNDFLFFFLRAGLNNSLGVQNLAALNQLAQAASPTSITGMPGLTSSGEWCLSR